MISAAMTVLIFSQPTLRRPGGWHRVSGTLLVSPGTRPGCEICPDGSVLGRSPHLDFADDTARLTAGGALVSLVPRATARDARDLTS